MTTKTNQNPQSTSAQEGLAQAAETESTQLTEEQLAKVAGGALDACNRPN